MLCFLPKWSQSGSRESCILLETNQPEVLLLGLCSICRCSTRISYCKQRTLRTRLRPVCANLLNVVAPETHLNDHSYSLRELKLWVTTQEFSVVGGYKEDLEKPQNCQNRGVGTCPGQYGICFTRHAYYLIMHLPEIKYSKLFLYIQQQFHFTNTLTWQQSWKAACGHWALTSAASLSNLWYLLVQLFPAPSEGQKRRAATTMKILRAVILVLSWCSHWPLLQWEGLDTSG